MQNSDTLVDPTILELVGYAADLLGLGEHIKKLVPVDRMRAGRRHKRVNKLLDDFLASLDDARAAIRVITSGVNEPLAQVPQDSIGFSIKLDELPVFRRGVDQILQAIREMTNSALALESASTGIPSETERFYKISEEGRRVLEILRKVVNGQSAETSNLLQVVEKYLVQCSEALRKREDWLAG